MQLTSSKAEAFPGPTSLISLRLVLFTASFAFEVRVKVLISIRTNQIQRTVLERTPSLVKEVGTLRVDTPFVAGKCGEGEADAVSATFKA